jgi:hypothetical protein
MFFRTLSGRFLLLTIIFVMLAEIFIFLPSVARFREDFLLSRLERAQIASLALLASDGAISDRLAAELLRTPGSTTWCCAATTCANWCWIRRCRADLGHLRPARPLAHRPDARRARGDGAPG